ncbi:hypothetical protein BU25DRAFT_204281 [Macroventuria anomochaeta]|uniref:Uncharacterized protein n=1 Tax=Macroventuria anomochaeta TaxID=301207 RepID=A0ACB6RMR2_9PLEO|nr:uncharacterized protein BU25DRAFT_204281 [Macroventuria anomochaeta]KAF2622690.1 hypothetical protein BU25DRAFT_204281 [Macroventuria anomochaeta]
MGDTHETPTERRPGIAIVRPKLHEDTQANRDLFKRWTKLHMRDTLSLPKDKDLGGASRVSRYTRVSADGGEDYFYTIVLDDVRLPRTKTFQEIPQRLDLENTRVLGEGEEAVLLPGDPRIGTEPMVFSIVAPVVGIFEAVVDTDTIQAVHKSHQDLPAEVASETNAPNYTLVTLTISHTTPYPTPFQHVQRLRSSLANLLGIVTNQLVYATVYRHAADAEPEVFSKIAQGQDGNGDWVVCVLVGGDADRQLVDAGYEGVEGQIEEWRKRLEIEGSLQNLDIKIGVWKGDVLMC